MVGAFLTERGMEFQMKTDDQEKARWPIVRLVRGIVKRDWYNLQSSNSNYLVGFNTNETGNIITDWTSATEHNQINVNIVEQKTKHSKFKYWIFCNNINRFSFGSNLIQGTTAYQMSTMFLSKRHKINKKHNSMLNINGTNTPSFCSMGQLKTRWRPLLLATWVQL